MNQIKENMPQNLGVEFAEYLSRKLNKKFECQEIRRIFGGASRETYRVRLIEKNKRKTITTQNVKNYVSIPDNYYNLKQKISINFQGLAFKFVMSLMAEIGKINI